MSSTRTIVGLFAAATLAACGGSGGGSSYPSSPSTPNTPTAPATPTNPASTNAVTVNDGSFSPGTITVPAGTTVTWTWPSCSGGDGYGGYGTCVSHNIMFDDGSNVTSGVQSEGTFARTFANKGTFKYHCTIHGTGMSGQINVT